jgi:hypothetical protein
MIRKFDPDWARKVELSYGEITWDGHQYRVIACINIDTGFTVNHKCCVSIVTLQGIVLTSNIIVNPLERVFPHTLHSFHGQLHEVRFLQVFSLEIREPGHRSKTVIDDPEYSFDSIDDCERFQSWLRCKQSVKTFEVETVTACKKMKLADYVCLKIWQDAFDGPSISILANNWTKMEKADMNLEFPIGSFKSDDRLGQPNRSKTLQLEFEAPEVPGKEPVNFWGKIGFRKSKGLIS